METKTEHGIKPVKVSKTRALWVSSIFYNPNCARNSKGKRIAEVKPKRFLDIPQPDRKNPTRIRDIAYIEAYTPTPETLAQNLTHNKNFELS